MTIAGIGLAGAITASKDMPSGSEDQPSEGLGTPAKMAIGAIAALAVPYAVGAGAFKGGKAAAKGLWNNKKAIADTVSDGAISVAENALGGAIGAAKGALYPAAEVGKKLTDIMIKQDPVKFKDNFMNLGLTTTGKAFIFTAAGAAGIKGGWDKYTESRSGQMVGAAGPTPEVAIENARGTMADMYGAGGDLVFALNQNRRG